MRNRINVDRQATGWPQSISRLHCPRPTATSAAGTPGTQNRLATVCGHVQARRTRICFYALVTACFLVCPGSLQARTWTDQQGRKAEAEFLDVKDGKVRLQSMKTSKIYELPMANLSKADQAYVTKLLTEPTPRRSPAADAEPLQQLEELTGIKISIPVLVGLALLNIPLYLLLGKFWFGGWAEFGECLRFWITPDSWSFWRGEGMEDFLSEFKLGAFFLLCVAAVCAKYYGVQMIFL